MGVRCGSQGKFGVLFSLLNGRDQSMFGDAKERDYM